MLFLIALVLLLGACGNGNQATASGETQAAPSEIPSPTATPTPDFAGTDFSGRWNVSEIVDSNGQPVSDAEKQNLGAGFVLELLPNTTYFVYGADGKVLGQGAYSVTLNQLTLTAQGSQTVYEILDADTLQITQPDSSITKMKREAVEPSEEDAVIDTASPDDTAQGDTGDDEESDFIDETEPSATPPPETSPATGPETAA